MTTYSSERAREQARNSNGRFGFQNRRTDDTVQLSAAASERSTRDVLKDSGYVEPPYRTSRYPYTGTRRKVDPNRLTTMPPPSQMKAVETSSGTLHIPYAGSITDFAQRTENRYVSVPAALTKPDGTIVKKFVSFTVMAGSIERNALDAAPEGNDVDFYRELDRYVDDEMSRDSSLRREEAPGLGRDPRHWARLLAGKARDRQAVAAAAVSSKEPRPVPAERIAKFLAEYVEDIKPAKPRR